MDREDVEMHRPNALMSFVRCTPIILKAEVERMMAIDSSTIDTFRVPK